MNRALTDAFSAALPLLGGSTRHVVRTVERRTNVAFEMPWKSAPAQAPAAGRGRKPERTQFWRAKHRQRVYSANDGPRVLRSLCCLALLGSCRRYSCKRYDHRAFVMIPVWMNIIVGELECQYDRCYHCQYHCSCRHYSRQDSSLISSV